MNLTKATALSRATGGSTHLQNPVAQRFAVSMIRGDGRYVMIEEDAGASYA